VKTIPIVVDESWLKRESTDSSRPDVVLSALDELEMIEAALVQRPR